MLREQTDDVGDVVNMSGFISNVTASIVCVSSLNK